ncbi:hypothetical protein U1Q18_009609, partial [Sarracenia purpurea var. burkii]
RETCWIWIWRDLEHSAQGVERSGSDLTWAWELTWLRWVLLICSIPTVTNGAARTKGLCFHGDRSSAFTGDPELEPR